MPIRINLLAEAQATEELRRKDPVKRAYLGAAMLVLLVLFWSSTLQFKIISSRSGLNDLESKWNAIEKNYKVAVEHQRQSIEADQKLTALQQLKTNRFLWATVLNAFQQTMPGSDDVQVVRLKTEQVYVAGEEVKARTNDTRLIAGRPASATERIMITVEGIDSSAQPGSQVNRFKEAIATSAYFQTALQKTNGVLLHSLSAPTLSGGRNPFVNFTLQCLFPDKVR